MRRQEGLGRLFLEAFQESTVGRRGVLVGCRQQLRQPAFVIPVVIHGFSIVGVHNRPRFILVPGLWQISQSLVGAGVRAQRWPRLRAGPSLRSGPATLATSIRTPSYS